jgi:hypothetical protein
MDRCTIFLEGGAIPLSLSRRLKEKWLLDFGRCSHEFVPKRTMRTDILVALMSHHTASSTARNDTLYINPYPANVDNMVSS